MVLERLVVDAAAHSDAAGERGQPPGPPAAACSPAGSPAIDLQYDDVAAAVRARVALAFLEEVVPTPVTAGEVAAAAAVGAGGGGGGA